MDDPSQPLRSAVVALGCGMDSRLEETEMVGRREAVKRFAKYTAPIMVAALISTSGSKKAAAFCPASVFCP